MTSLGSPTWDFTELQRGAEKSRNEKNIRVRGFLHTRKENLFPNINATTSLPNERLTLFTLF